MIVLDPGEITRVVREPRDVQKEKQAAAQEANRARLEEQRQKNEEKKRMKVGVVGPVAAQGRLRSTVCRPLPTSSHTS